jgi:hypothetical protein
VRSSLVQYRGCTAPALHLGTARRRIVCALRAWRTVPRAPVAGQARCLGAGALLPMTTARLLALVNRVLPGGEASDTTQRRGRDSEIGVLALGADRTGLARRSHAEPAGHRPDSGG